MTPKKTHIGESSIFFGISCGISVKNIKYAHYRRKEEKYAYV